MDENLRNRFKIGTDQHTEGVEFKKILILKRLLFEKKEEKYIINVPLKRSPF